MPFKGFFAALRMTYFSQKNCSISRSLAGVQKGLSFDFFASQDEK